MSSTPQELGAYPVATEGLLTHFEEGPVVKCQFRQLTVSGFGWRGVWKRAEGTSLEAVVVTRVRKDEDSKSCDNRDDRGKRTDSGEAGEATSVTLDDGLLEVKAGRAEDSSQAFSLR